jgi:hypothetical protein
VHCVTMVDGDKKENEPKLLVLDEGWGGVFTPLTCFLIYFATSFSLCGRCVFLCLTRRRFPPRVLRRPQCDTHHRSSTPLSKALGWAM